MSILASPSACLFNLKPHSSLNSHSAFKKPSMPKKPAQASQESYSQPIKKIKNDCSKPVSVYPKQQEIKTKPNRLTIEDVFDTPLQSKTNCKDLFIDEFADEGSSLSFISSCTSLDSLEEVTAIEPNKNSDRNMVCESTQEPLFIKDDIMNQLNNLLSSQMLNSNQFCAFQPAEFLQTLQWEEQDLLRNASQPLTYIDPINISFMKLNEYVGQGADNNEFYSDFNLFAKKGLEVKKNKSDLEDGDYFERESTAYDAADSSDKSKGGSPTYGGLFDMSEEERTSDKVIRISKKQGKTAKKAKKEKLVRPQVEKVKKEKIRVNKISSQEMMQQTIKELRVSEDSQAVLPMLSFDSEREQRVVVKSVWDPETINTQEMEVYFEQLSQVIESAVTDQEAAIKLLKDFGMNISLVLEIVSQNQALYKEMFRVKVKRLRRNGAI